MSEIEKMYKNVGVARIGNKKCTPAEFLDCQNYCFISENNKCDKFSFEYPPFTAEKQIELIKFLSKNYEGVDISKGFEESLAGAINELWADMSEEEKQQVRRILKK